MKLLTSFRAPVVRKAVRQHDRYENAVMGRRRCHWIDSLWSHIDCSLMRSGDVSYGPLARRVY
jgi:hypothetical protein